LANQAWIQKRSVPDTNGYLFLKDVLVSPFAPPHPIKVIWILQRQCFFTSFSFQNCARANFFPPLPFPFIKGERDLCSTSYCSARIPIIPLHSSFSPFRLIYSRRCLEKGCFSLSVFMAPSRAFRLLCRVHVLRHRPRPPYSPSLPIPERFYFQICP